MWSVDAILWYTNTEDMTLYLVWDSESETSKDCTMLTTGMSATDANYGDDDESPKPKRKKPKRSSTESDSETDESAESESEEDWESWYHDLWYT